MRSARHFVPLLAVAALAALAGCGGGGDDTTESTASTTTEAASLTKADLIAQGDAICAEVNAAVGSADASETETAASSTQVPNLYVGMVQDIEALGAPTETAGYAEFSQAAEELAQVQGEVKLAAEREDSVALAEAETEATAALAQFQGAAGTYGFTECAEGPSAPAAVPGAEEPGATEEGGVEAEIEPEAEEAAPEEVAPEEEAAPETGGAGGAIEEVAPEGGGTGSTGGGGGQGGGSSGGVGPG
ncbi:MAG TPA: hypothetical protein VFJ99_03130 [Solirubrobacterales bacterium]|nr:hypothetical protein [Solirubrobacterales bacterium]